jgi:hypothetical protein
MHLRCAAQFALEGGFPGNGGHNTTLNVQCSLQYNWTGSVSCNNAGIFGYGVLAPYAGLDVDAPIDLTANFSVGTPLTLAISVETLAGTYGNIDYSPGVAGCDAGGYDSDYSGRGLRIEEVNGQVMTLPEGYTLNSPSWGIVDNHLTGVTGVPASSLPTTSGLELAGANPTAGQSRLTLALARGGDVRVAVHDVAGRELRVLVAGYLPAGRNALEWDGRDAAGQPAAAGVYFVRASSGGQAWTRGVVRLP